MRTPLEASNVARPTDGVWIIRFNWESNPIPANGSWGHPLAHARKVRQVRERARYQIRYARIPQLGRCTAQLTWWVTTNRRRDVDNLAPLEKPLFDALVDEHVVPDDTPEFMTKPRGLIVNVRDSAGLLTEPCFTFRIQRIDPEENDL